MARQTDLMIGNDGDDIDSRTGGSPPAQPEDQASDADIPWSQLDTPFVDLFWSHWSPIEHSLAEIDQLMTEGSTEYKIDSSSENEMEYQRWRVEYAKPDGRSVQKPPRLDGTRARFMVVRSSR